MVRCVLTCVLLQIVLFAHGSTADLPPPEEDPPDRPVKPPAPPPPEFDPKAPPPDAPKPGPTTPGDAPPPPAPGDPGAPNPTYRRPAVRNKPRARSGAGTANAWRIWWEYNREHLIGLRALQRDAGTVTGARADEERNPMAKRRPEVLDALRETARKGKHRVLRAAAVIALGRMGTDEDARFIIELLYDTKQSRDVHEAAAVAIGIMETIDDGPTKRTASAFLRYVTKNSGALPTRARGMAVLAAGMRARTDPALAMFLLGQANSSNLRGEEAGNLAFALGLAQHPVAVPELMEAVRKGRFGKRRLSETSRAHAALALARINTAGTVPLLSSLLTARSAGIPVRRSAALALGRLLREGPPLDEADQKRASRALLTAFRKSSDSVVKGFAAIAMGTARTPIGIAELRDAIDHGGNMDVKPFCALALGFAARTSNDTRIGRFLTEELRKTKDDNLSSALAIALGIAGAEQAREPLLEIVNDKRAPARRRGAAAQGLGLLRSRAPEVGRSLETLATTEKSPALVGDAVLALGMMGRRGLAPQLAELLKKSKSGMLQGRLCLALAHLDHEDAVDVLLAVLTDKNARSLVREFAAVGLGVMGDRRAVDPLFAIDAYFNFYSTTIASRELVRLY